MSTPYLTCVSACTSYLEEHLIALGVKTIAQWTISNGNSVQYYLHKELKGILTIPSDLPFTLP
ncbi:hypothetical protein OB236_10920 [Paenibacillus sp. WQ 127069]|uniref:Uncharacterized protein n=1 Tax=Paenibacillus baimaensis TaxID=2982185 RepID=A0ABT2UDC3_9BACL|nr:hypothetical protein [Paenibacillus sp. WQ 127069]MCU6792631.1 hypothetical protein [Paenibacillus sp. WQ 127069]